MGRRSWSWWFVLGGLATGCQLVTSGIESGAATSLGDPVTSSDGTSEDGTSENGTTGGTTSVADAEGSGGSGSTSASGGADDTSGSIPPDCSRDNGGCDPNATCSDGSGGVECTCNPGYEGDGQQCSVDATLPTLRIEAPCTGQPGCSAPYCVISDASVRDEAMLTGDPAISYEVTLRFRGVVEEKAYFGGSNDGFWNEGGTPDDDGWNTLALEISEPEQSYWLNSGTQGANHCEMLDYQRTVSMRGGSVVSVLMLDPNLCAARNLSDGGGPIVIPGIPPAPDAFDGQFLQVDVVDIVPVP